MDLDRFKEVNDALGQDVGDDLLCGVGRRLSQVLRDHDTFARLGGDEFAVLLPGADEGAASLAADRILEALVPAFQLDGHRVEVRASVGSVVYPDHGQDRETLLRHADVAMYGAKQAQGRQAVYAPGDDRNSPERLALVGALRHAIDLGGLSLHYQPKLDYAARAVRSVEALVRWDHPERGMLAPVVFIGLAEQSDLIERLTTWVLDEAVRQAAAWRASGVDLQVSINLSALNLREETLPTRVLATLERWGLPPESLVVEITESALMADPPRALAVANEIRALGVTLAVDDFGTGLSALAYLQHLPAQQLKIDRCFVRNMRDDDGDAAIVRSTIALAHDLGLSVVAEGVEDAETLEMLAELDCDVAQGFHLSRPIPPEALVAWLIESRWWPEVPVSAAPLALPARGPGARRAIGPQAG